MLRVGDFSDGDFGDGGFSDGDFGDSDFGDGDFGEGEFGDGDFGGGDFNDGHVNDSDLFPRAIFQVAQVCLAWHRQRQQDEENSWGPAVHKTARDSRPVLLQHSRGNHHSC